MAFNEDRAVWFANARLGADVRSATELGTLRAYFRIKTGGEYVRNDNFDISAPDAGIVVDRAFISLGYLTAGYAANFFDSFGGIYGDNDRNEGSEDRLQLSVLADGLGGGFYAGVQILAPDDGLAAGFGTAADGTDLSDLPDVQAIVGVKDQPWGSAALGVWYSPDDDGNGNGFWAVKLGGEVKATDQLSVAARVYYQDFDNNGGDYLTAGAGVSFKATDALTVNANGAYYNDVADESGWGATLGVDYTVVAGLVATAEVTYDDGHDGFDNDWAGLLRLSREW